MEELKLTGNHLKGSRPILTFSTHFDKEPHWKLLKEMIMQVCKHIFTDPMIRTFQVIVFVSGNYLLMMGCDFSLLHSVILT